MAEANEMDLTFEDAARRCAWNVRFLVAGELDMRTRRRRCRATPTPSPSGDAPKVAVDSRTCRSADSSSLGLLVSNFKRLRERGGDLAIVGSPARPRRCSPSRGSTT